VEFVQFERVLYPEMYTVFIIFLLFRHISRIILYNRIRIFVKTFDTLQEGEQSLLQANFFSMATQYQKRKRFHGIWKKITLILSSVVVFCTTYALILPAITMEPDYVCGHEAHIHEAACYQIPESTPVTDLVCDVSTLGIHEHTSECFNENGEPKCGIADFVLHSHIDSCFDAEGDLACSLPEIEAHVHDEDCWLQPHIHEEACYTQQQSDLLCTIEEGTTHTHEEACFTARQNQICELPVVEPHTHGEDCWTKTTEQTCQQEETEGHLHGEDCYDESNTLVCLLSESAGHTHTDDCYQVTETFTCALEETEGHAHGETCFETVLDLTCTLSVDIPHIHTGACYSWSPVLSCVQLTAEEGAVPVMVCEEQELYPHTHSSECFAPDSTLICTLLEVTEHNHEDACFVSYMVQPTEPVLICQLEVHEHTEDCVAKEEATDADLSSEETLINGLYCGLVEHEHQDGCFNEEDTLMCTMTEHEHDWICELAPSDFTAVEIPDDWEADLPELNGHIADDLIAVAKSQLGYAENKENYILEDEDIYCYNRYSAWWDENEPYTPWNAKFVSFCLNYADIDFELYEDPAFWFEDLQWDDQLLPEDSAPIAADLVFFDLDNDAIADRVGIITEVDNTTGSFDAILERRGMVRSLTHDLTDSDILGYARIPGNESDAAPAVVSENVQQVIDLIDAMPFCDEIYAQLDAYYEADDTEGEEAYLMRVGRQGQYAYACYQALTEEEKVQVHNIQKLMDSSGIWAAATLEEPVDDDVVHEEGSVTGTYYHAPGYKYYEYSPYRVKQSDIMTFTLVPKGEYSADWVPNTVTWSAKTDANFLPAYCAECLITVSDGGADYDSYILDNSRFASSELRKELAGIIAHSYPYLTVEEMQAELAEAFENGEIPVDVSSCTPGEYMAATQAAIWQKFFPTMDFSEFSYPSDYLNASEVAKTVHPITDLGHLSGLTDANTKDEQKAEMVEHCKVIMDWLLAQAVPDDLKVEDYQYSIEKNEYDLYTLTVDTTFNRKVIAGEIIKMQLLAGKQETDMVELPSGTEQFSITLEDLTEDELLNAVISLDLSGQRMQAYYFENSKYQDMVTGQWEAYAEDLSFAVTADSTEVCVTKHWTEDAPENMVIQVRLYANGSQIREIAELSAENGWTYTWTALSKTDVLGNAIEYSVRETPVSGYYTTVERIEGEQQSVRMWEVAESFEDGKQYMLISNAGGLAAYFESSTERKLTWTTAYPENVNACKDGLIWTAKAADDNKFFLYNDYVGGALGYRDFLANIYYRMQPLPDTKSTKWMPLIYTDGLLRGTFDGITTLDFSYIGTNNGVAGCGYFRDYSALSYSYADHFTLYKLIEKEVPPAEINFFITNTKIREDVPLINVSVEKKWEGRPDDVYPERVSVQLMQNDHVYGDAVELSSENGWLAVWSNLPTMDNDDNAFAYTVKELDAAGYTATQTASTTEEGVYAITLTNTWNRTGANVELQKVDFYNGETLLPGAKFDIYLASETASEWIPGANGATGVLYDQVAVGDAGTVELSLPVNETYYLVETQAPEGYNLSGTAIGFTVTQRGTLVMLELVSGEDIAQTTDGAPAVLTVKNKPGYTLPETGGLGTALYYLGGAGMMGFPIFTGVHRRKKRRDAGG